MPLENKDQRHLTVAMGYHELGMFLDADAELDRITSEERITNEHVVESRNP
jgi:hypothetical protein